MRRLRFLPNLIPHSWFSPDSRVENSKAVLLGNVMGITRVIGPRACHRQTTGSAKARCNVFSAQSALNAQNVDPQPGSCLFHPRTETPEKESTARPRTG